MPGAELSGHTEPLVFMQAPACRHPACSCVRADADLGDVLQVVLLVEWASAQGLEVDVAAEEPAHGSLLQLAAKQPAMRRMLEGEC